MARFYTILLMAVSGCVCHCPASAQENLVLHYDFKTVNGSDVTDASPSGITATMKGDAKVELMGEYPVLHLGNSNGWLDMGEDAGAVFKNLNAYTISMYYRVDEEASLSGNGYFLWSWSTSVSCTVNTGSYSAYRLNNQHLANATAGYGTESVIAIGGSASKGLWYHVVYKQVGTTGKLYLNGELVGSNTNMHNNVQIFGEQTPKYCFIGRPPFGNDNYLKNTLVTDIRLYNTVLSDAEIKEMSTLTQQLDYAYRYGQTGDFTKLKEAVGEAQAFISTIDQNAYPASAIAEYEDVVSICAMVCAEGMSTQTIIDEYVAMLASSKKKLERSKGFTFDLSKLRYAYDTDRGFRHPGGLHTYQDFERIRRQISNNQKNVVTAYDMLTSSFFSQSTTGTYATVEVIRGGGSGENYINCARAAHTAYQNGLRWQIEGNRACAMNAVNILMEWARTMKYIGGDSNYALAAGLYGYEFAQAGELVRDFDGWSEEDFNTFRHWMLDTWYASASGFLRGRNGTWQNTYGQGGERPGHYWSNWGLCNALCVVSIGILCDDVFIYNQGMSFLKYDQTHTFNFHHENTVGPIYNSLCNEFWGGLIPVVHADERGAYGYLGQMQESGRDQGHANMALGLAVDCAQTAWNQGDDLYSYMNNRLAAGIEWQAAWNMAYDETTQTNNIDLPWTEYVYNAAGSAWHNAWFQSTPAIGFAVRNYWGRVIGHYEGVKGHTMPYAKQCLNQMGVDGGGGGATSGGYDHLGFSVLTCTYDNKATSNQIPTLLTPHVEYSVGGKNYSLDQCEVGGLVNDYNNHPTDAVPKGTVITLMPRISDTEHTGDTGEGTWLWNTGETTQNITITANRSQVYRVCYTNKNGVESEQIFTIAVADDCENVEILPTITIDDVDYSTNTIDVFYGKKVILNAYGRSYYGNYQWENGQTSSTIELPAVTRSRDISVTFTNAGGRVSLLTFHLNVVGVRPDAVVDNTTLTNQTLLIVDAGSDVSLSPTPSGTISAGEYTWTDENGTEIGHERVLQLDNVQTSGIYNVVYSIGEDNIQTITYTVFVREANDRLLDTGNYVVCHRASGLLLANGGETAVLKAADGVDDLSVVWTINRSATARYDLISTLDGQYLKADGTLTSKTYRPLRFTFAAGSDHAAIYTSSNIYWTVTPDNQLDFETADILSDYPFDIIPVESWITGVSNMQDDKKPVRIYTPSGIAINHLQPGLNIVRMSDGTTRKINVK